MRRNMRARKPLFFFFYPSLPRALCLSQGTTTPVVSARRRTVAFIMPLVLLFLYTVYGKKWGKKGMQRPTHKSSCVVAFVDSHHRCYEELCRPGPLSSHLSLMHASSLFPLSLSLSSLCRCIQCPADMGAGCEGNLPSTVSHHCKYVGLLLKTAACLSHRVLFSVRARPLTLLVRM